MPYEYSSLELGLLLFGSCPGGLAAIAGTYEVVTVRETERERAQEKRECESQGE